MTNEHEVHGGHVEKEYSIAQIALNLAITCVISGLILAVTYFLTHPIALQKQKMLTDLAMKSLVQADTFTAVEGHEGWYAAETGGDVIAYVVPGESKGFGGPVKLLVAVSTEGTVIDYSITSANETPGLGTKAAEDPFKSQFAGKAADALSVVKDPSNTENIQAITGATITSRAVTKGVKEAVDEVVAYMGGQ